MKWVELRNDSFVQIARQDCKYFVMWQCAMDAEIGRKMYSSYMCVNEAKKYWSVAA